MQPFIEFGLLLLLEAKMLVLELLEPRMLELDVEQDHNA